MCIIAYKPLNVAFPEEAILQNCFNNNDHGAGFMYAFEGSVHIHKGYETFEKFMAALNKARAVTGDKVPYVMHFRIATQGYDKCMTHPFPLSSKMQNLKRLHYKCNIGVAHNGILDITSDGAKTYSDTMKFITDYLSNIIQSYDWYKNKRNKKLIEYLIDGSRLAILDRNNHCELMGKGWEKDNGIYYSNHTWAYSKYAGFSSASANGYYGRAWWDYDDDYDDFVWDKDKRTYVRKSTLKSSGTTAPASSAGDKKTDTAVSAGTQKPVDLDLDPWRNYWWSEKQVYDFDEDFCPVSVDNDDSYCNKCANCAYCSNVAAQKVYDDVMSAACKKA